MAVERRPLVRALAMALGERVAVLAKSLADEPCVGVGRVGDRAALASALRYASHEMPAGDLRQRIDGAASAGAASSCTRLSTPSETLQRRDAAATIVLKAENLQRTGSFKIRGAMSKLVSLGDAAARRCHRRERRQPRPGTRVRRSPLRRAVRDLRACGRVDGEDRGMPRLRRDGVAERRLARRGRRRGTERAAETGMVFCHPLRRPRRSIAGQATLGIELSTMSRTSGG